MTSFRPFRMPAPVRWAYPGAYFKQPGPERVVYLTFDDGPTSQMLPWILDQLERFNARATFFCVGENVRRHPQLFRSLLERGHRVGNHTHRHLNGWQTSTRQYLSDIHEARSTIHGDLFRPPYGRLRWSQYRKLRAQGMHIVLWSLLTYDFDRRISSAYILNQLRSQLRPGDIIVFHDHVKAAHHLWAVLPAFLSYLHQLGYRCAVL